MKKIIALILALVACSSFLASDSGADEYYYLPYFTSLSGYWFGLGLSNCSDTQNAAITTTIYDTNGTVIKTETRSIPARGQTSFLIGSGLNKEGWVKVVSDKPLTGLCFFGTSGSGNYMADINVSLGTSTNLHIPHVGQNNQWDTTIFVCNPNSETTAVTFTFVAGNGSPDTARTYNLPAQKSLKLPLADIITGGTSSGGRVEISATRGVVAFALYNNLKTGGFSCAGINAVVPEECGGGSTQYESDKLFGYWHFWYTIISTFHDYYDLNRRERLNDQGEYYVSGTDEYDDLVLGTYYPDDGYFALLDPGILFDKFYTFNLNATGTAITSGTYCHVDPDTSEIISNLYSLSGTKIYSNPVRLMPGDEIDQALAEQLEVKKYDTGSRSTLDLDVLNIYLDLKEAIRGW